ncbi:MAG: hypothetical protein EXR49_07885 [Dehalococcoidia bacterium]|nr:hypothetical protein [Dehalococcoidia bacterium]
MHFVNTDPHPTHNGLPQLNSTALKKGESYAFTFSSPGIFPYHCSAHVPEGMTGQVLVQS